MSIHWLRQLLFLFLFLPFSATSQQFLSLRDAVTLARQNYGTLKAKAKFAAASRAAVDFSRSEYLPNFNLAGQWDYGTVNGQIGPAYGFGGLGVASSGLPAPSQSWNAAFGAIYLTNINWEFFAFGRARERIKIAEATALRDENDLTQELFQHTIKVSAAYLNLLVAQRLRASYEKNLARTEAIGTVVTNRARSGLVPGVDSSLAHAEISGARLAIVRALDFEQEQQNSLEVLMGVATPDVRLDTAFVSRLPAGVRVLSDTDTGAEHPTLQFFRSRIGVSDQQTRYFKTLYLPSFSLVGIFQTRGSGFGATYAVNQEDFTHNIGRGFLPVRSNYLLGLGVTWNLTQPLRYGHQVKGQQLISEGLQEEYNLAGQQIAAQLKLADLKLKNAMDGFREAPLQVRAASDAYLQKTVMYRNGLINLIDLNQALYALIRAETDRDVAHNNVWQALLLRAAATGDYSLFENAL